MSTPVPASRDWDAATYDRISGPQLQWAREQLDRLSLHGDEVVLDAGCGSGRVTVELAERVPHGRVYLTGRHHELLGRSSGTPTQAPSSAAAGTGAGFATVVPQGYRKTSTAGRWMRSSRVELMSRFEDSRH